MATVDIVPTKLQKLEFDAKTNEGNCKVTVVTGELQFFVQASSSGPNVFQSISIKALVDPTLAPGKFRKATATASIAHSTHQGTAVPMGGSWVLDEAQATYDDEEGKVQLRVDVTVGAVGNGSLTNARTVLFQVTTLAMA